MILKKIAAMPRQHGLSVALREIGRIERSIFVCEWLLDTRLRRRSHAILAGADKLPMIDEPAFDSLTVNPQ